MIHHQVYTGLPHMSSVEGSQMEPYTLSVHGETTTIARDRKQNLINTISHELGEGVQIANNIALHKSAHYYSHFLQPGDGIALCVPKDYPNVQ